MCKLKVQSNLFLSEETDICVFLLCALFNGSKCYSVVILQFCGEFINDCQAMEASSYNCTEV